MTDTAILTKDQIAELSAPDLIRKIQARLRSSLGNSISQNELARMLGVDQMTLSRWLHGHHKPRQIQRKKLEALLLDGPSPETPTSFFVRHEVHTDSFVIDHLANTREVWIIGSQQSIVSTMDPSDIQKLYEAIAHKIRAEEDFHLFFVATAGETTQAVGSFLESAKQYARKDLYESEKQDIDGYFRKLDLIVGMTRTLPYNNRAASDAYTFIKNFASSTPAKLAGVSDDVFRQHVHLHIAQDFLTVCGFGCLNNGIRTSRVYMLYDDEHYKANQRTVDVLTSFPTDTGNIWTAMPHDSAIELMHDQTAVRNLVKAHLGLT